MNNKLTKQGNAIDIKKAEPENGVRLIGWLYVFYNNQNFISSLSLFLFMYSQAQSLRTKVSLFVKSFGSNGQYRTPFSTRWISVPSRSKTNDLVFCLKNGNNSNFSFADKFLIILDRLNFKILSLTHLFNTGLFLSVITFGKIRE